MGFFRYVTFYSSVLGGKIWFGSLLIFTAGALDIFGLATTIPLIISIFSNEGMKDILPNDGLWASVLDLFNYIGSYFGISFSSIIVMAVAIFFLSKSVFLYFSFLFFSSLRGELLYKIRSEVVVRLSTVTSLTYKEKGEGYFQSLVIDMPERVAQGFQFFIYSLAMMLLSLILLLPVLFYAFEFVLIVLISLFLSMGLLRVVDNKVKKSSAKAIDSRNKMSNYFSERISCFNYLLFTGNNTKHDFLDDQGHSDTVNKQVDIWKKIALARTLKEPLGIFSLGFSAFIYLHYFNGDSVDLIMGLLFMYRGLSALFTAHNYWNSSLEYDGSLKEIKSYIDKRLDEEDSGCVTFSEVNDIELKGVSFKYSQKSPFLFRDLSFKFKKREVVGIFGPSGAGKTTLIELLVGAMLPTTGSVLVNGVNSKNINTIDFRKKIGYLTQEPAIFSGTIKENIIFRSTYDKTKFDEVIELCSLSEFLENFSEREDALLGVNGVSISGGQRQRLAIGRELIKKPDVLILDEPTSALDIETEAKIIYAIKEMKKYCIVIIISHNPEVMNIADKVINLDKLNVIKNVEK